MCLPNIGTGLASLSLLYIHLVHHMEELDVNATWVPCTFLLTAIVTWLSMVLWSSTEKEGGEKKSGKGKVKSITFYNHVMRLLREEKQS